MNTEWLNPLNWGSLMVEGAKNRIDLFMIELFNDVVAASFNLCLVAGMIGLILYIYGFKKGKTVAYISPVIYIIIRILGSVIAGV
ncbi:MAG: hypothetical protein RR657_07095 [Peptostreptococcaceae bacterium]